MIKSTTTLSLALLSTLLLFACAPLNAVRIQEEKTQRIDLGNEILFAAAIEFVEAQGWEVDSSDPGLGVLEALGPVDDSEGMTTRERWRISTRDQEIGIELALEYLDAGTWRSESFVCHTYTYARENDHLTSIANIAKNNAKNNANERVALGNLASAPTGKGGGTAQQRIALSERDANN